MELIIKIFYHKNIKTLDRRVFPCFILIILINGHEKNNDDNKGENQSKTKTNET